MKKICGARLIAPIISLLFILSACSAPNPSPTVSLEPTSEPVPSEALTTLPYKMAKIAEQEAICPHEFGLDENIGMLNHQDFTDVVFHALTFVVELDNSSGYVFSGINVSDAKTGADLSSTPTSALHVYKGNIPTSGYVKANPSAGSNEMITCVFVSLDKYTLSKLSIDLTYTDSASEYSIPIAVNCKPEDINTAPLYSTGNNLVRLGEQYYVLENSSGFGLIPGTLKYHTRVIRCVSLPLTGAVSGLDSGSVALFDKKTGTAAGLPAGLELYYSEGFEEGRPEMQISIGLSASDENAFAKASALIDSTCPGFIIDGKQILLP